MTKEKITHDHECDICGKPAKYNLQKNPQLYSIDETGDFNLEDEWEGSINEFYCEDCYGKYMDI